MSDPTTGTIEVPGARLAWRRTPWDERAFGVATVEVLELASSEVAPARSALLELERLAPLQRLGVATTRFPAGDRVLKEAYGASDWRYIETSLVLGLQGLAGRDVSRTFRRTVALEEPDEGAWSEIRAIARDTFHFSRFDEDVRFERARCQGRFANWIDELRHQGKRFLVHRADGRIAAFMAFSVSSGVVDLVLGGSRSDLGWISPFFWASLVGRLREEGHRAIEARVSAANVGVARIYLALGFTILRTDVGFNRIFPHRAGQP